jgi:hypothetical protein
MILQQKCQNLLQEGINSISEQLELKRGESAGMIGWKKIAKCNEVAERHFNSAILTLNAEPLHLAP